VNILWFRRLAAVLFVVTPAFSQGAHPPVITALNPPARRAGQAFTLQVTGSRFCFGSFVRFGTFQFNPISTSPTQLTVAVSADATQGITGPVPVVVDSVDTSLSCESNGLVSDPFNFISAAQLILETMSLPPGGVGSSYSATVVAAGGAAPYTFAANQLPQGLTINPQTGVISGTPTLAGTSNPTISVTDTSGQSAQHQYQLVITSAPTITTSSLPSGTVSVAYSAPPLTASGGTGPYTWSLIAGPPPGLTLSPAGVLSGTPTQAGSFNNVQIRVTDANGAQGFRVFSIVINSATPPQISTGTLPNGTVGVSYGPANLVATGGNSPFNWILVSGGPPGLTLSLSGSLAGTPTQSGTYPNVAIRATDSSGVSADRTFSITIAPAATLQITTTSLPDATRGVFYTTTLQATPAASLTWQTTSPLPSGITFSSSGVLSGTTQQTGSFPIAFSVSSGNQTANSTLTLTVNEPAQTCIPFPSGFVPFQTVSYLSPPNAAGDRILVGSLQSAGFSGIAGIPLPTVVNQKFCDANVRLQSVVTQLYQNVYVPTAAERAGDFSAFNGLLTDPLTGSPFPGGIIPTSRLGSVYAWRMGPQTPVTPVSISTTTLPQATAFLAYQTSLTAAGGTQPYTWSAPTGLPAGLALNPNTGILSGTPTAEGVFPFNIQVRDANGQTDTRILQLIVGSPMTITTASLRNGQVSVPYEDFFSVIGGVGPYVWTSFGAPPPGLFVNAIGSLTGTPLFAGTFNLSVRVTDSRGQTATRSYSITISPLFRIVTETLSTATLGVFYEQVFASNGGTSPIFWQIPGNPPAGLVLSSSNGILSGFPTQSGSFFFTILATDATGLQTSRSYTLTVNQGLRIAPENLPNGSTGVPYSQTFTVTGGTAPYVYQIAGSVPGITLDPATGAFRGTPTQPGTFTFTIRANDAAGALGTKAYTLIVVSNLQITTSSLPDAIDRVAYAQTLAASGGTQPFTWRITQGSLPEGLSLNAATGTISGTPVRAGASNITVEVADSAAQTASRALTLNVLPSVTVQTAGTLGSGIIGVPYNALLNASGGTPPYSWRVREGALPDGTQLSSAGQISGTPTRTGRFTATVQATDSAGRSAAAEIFITINPPLLRFTSSERLPDATAGADYTFTPTVTGGTPPYRYTLNGAPAGLAIDGDSGVVSGRVLTTGTLEFSIRVTDSNQVLATQSVTLRSNLPATPTISITGLPPSTTAGQQVSPRVAIAQPYPLPLGGELNLTFEPAVGVDDPAIQFASGGRRVVFNIPAGQTDAVFNAVSPGIQTGTVAGTIRVTPRLTALGTDVTPSPVPVTTITIPRLAPVITSARINRTSGGFELVITAYATSREITSAAVRLQTTGTVQGTDFTVNLATITVPFYQSAASNQFGSLCTITIPFTVQGTSGAVTSASVTLTNAVGTSAAATANF